MTDKFYKENLKEFIEEINMTNEEVDAEFDAIYKADPAFEEMLSGYVDNFSHEEKYTIVCAYK